MIDENRKFRIEGVVRAKKFLDLFLVPMILPLSGVITTNYDMLAEYALGTQGFNYGIPNQMLIGRGPYPVSTWGRPVTVTGQIRLAKIHGSISWEGGGRYTDGRGGVTGNALVVAPTLEKQIPESLEFEWGIAEQILEKSTRLIVFGFAFNPYDEAVLTLLRSAGRNLDSVLLIDVHPQIERAQALWPNARIVISLPPPDGINQIRDWRAK